MNVRRSGVRLLSAQLKEDLKDLNGERLFPDRHASSVAFEINREEFALYNAVTAYINEFIPQQTGQRRSSGDLSICPSNALGRQMHANAEPLGGRAAPQKNGARVKSKG